MHCRVIFGMPQQSFEHQIADLLVRHIEVRAKIRSTAAGKQTVGTTPKPRVRTLDGADLGLDAAGNNGVVGAARIDRILAGAIN